MPPVKGGLEDVVAANSAISDINGSKGKLAYRGVDIDELAQRSSFEETTYLLWYGALPTGPALRAFTDELAVSRPLPEALLRLMGEFPAGARPIDALRTVLSAIAFYDSRAGDNAGPANLEKALRVTAQTATIVAAWHAIREGRSPLPPEPRGSHAESFLRMLFGSDPDPLSVRAMDLALILHADHELNASTFAARVAAATLADVYAAIVAAVAALSGPLHGGANEQVMKMLQAVGRPERADAYVSQALAAHQKVPGFGHRVYRTEDPRATHLREMSRRLAEHTGNRLWYDISRRVEAAMLEQRLYPNVDLYSASCYAVIGIPTDLFTTVFAVSRVAGWAAHTLEQYGDNRLIRPRAEYIGPTSMPYLPLEQRRPTPDVAAEDKHRV